MKGLNMGKSSKRKAQGAVAQIADSPKKAKLELTNKPEQKSPKIKKNNKQQNEGTKGFKTKANVKSQSNKDNTSQQNKEQKSTKTQNKNVKKAHQLKNKNTLKTTDQNKQGKTSIEDQFIIPAEFAQNMNKRTKQVVSKKLRYLIKLRQIRGEDVNKEDINKLMKEIIEQKCSNNTNNFKLDNDQKTISTNVVKSKKKKLMQKKKKTGKN